MGFAQDTCSTSEVNGWTLFTCPLSTFTESSFTPDGIEPRPDTSGILNGAINRPNLALDPDAVEPWTRGIVIMDSCVNPQNGEIGDCARLCADPETMFGQWWSIWQCLALSSLTLIDERFPAVGQDVLDALDNVLGEVQGFDSASFDALAVVNNTITCAEASCIASNDCEIDFDGVDQPFPYQDSFFTELSKLCDNIEPETNGDIVGPGVLISYQIQMSLALLIWVLVRVFTLPHTLDTVDWLFRVFGSSRESFSDRHPAIVSKWTGLKNSVLAEAADSFMIDFHESQCFLLLGIWFTILVALRYRLRLVATDWQSLLVNRTIFFEVGMTGFFPVILVLSMIARQKTKSAYNVFLSALTILLIPITRYSRLGAEDSTAEGVYRSFRDAVAVDECGGQAAMRAFCIDREDELVTYHWRARHRVAVWTLFSLSVVCVGRMLSQFSLVKRLFRSFKSESEEPKTRQSMGIFSYIGWLIGKTVVFATEFVPLAYIFMTLAKAELTPLFGWDLVDGDWGIGQLLALLVWLPPVLKFTVLLIRGIPGGTEDRYSQNYKLVKKSELKSSPPSTIKADSTLPSDVGLGTEYVPLDYTHGYSATSIKG